MLKSVKIRVTKRNPFMKVRKEKSFNYTESTLQQAGVGGGERIKKWNDFATKAKRHFMADVIYSLPSLLSLF